jgi:hypothetical protein
VVTTRPSHCTTRVRHPFIRRPSTSTVQVPHAPSARYVVAEYTRAHLGDVITLDRHGRDDRAAVTVRFGAPLLASPPEGESMNKAWPMRPLRLGCGWWRLCGPGAGPG